MTREMLDELLVDVPQRVVPDVGAAWERGLRRRRRTTARWVAGVVVVTGLAASVVHSATIARRVEPADSSAVVDGHPGSVPRPLSLPTMPSRPGPMAGVFSHDRDQWVVVSASGRSWRVPGVTDIDSFQPALSDDGTKLGWLRAGPRGREDEATYVLADLVTGERREFPEIGDNAGVITQPYWMQGQIPSFWSPDNRRLLLFAQAEPVDGTTAVIVSLDGELREVPRDGVPVGWAGSDRIVWLRQGGVVVTTDLDGTEVTRVQLPVTLKHVSQWDARVSPDGTEIAVNTSGRHFDWTLSTFSLETGDQIGEPTRFEHVVMFSTPLWAGDRPAVWLDEGIVDVRTGDRLVALSRWWNSNAGYWAADALGGDSSSTIGLRLDWRYWSFLWWWKEILVGLFALAVVTGFLLLARRTRRRPTRGPDSVDWWGGEPA